MKPIFITDQLDAIYQTTVAWIFCIVGDIHTIQYDTFQRPSYKYVYNSGYDIT